MPRATAETFAWGTTVVAALLWFAGAVALFRHDLGNPRVAAGLFALVGAVVFVAGRLILHRHSRR